MATLGGSTFIGRAILLASGLLVLHTAPGERAALHASAGQTVTDPRTPGGIDEEKDRVMAVVKTFLDRLGRQRIYALAPLLAENAVVITARERSVGYETVVEPASKWLARMSEAPNPEPFEERIRNPNITIDSGHLATVRADFEIVRRGVTESSGIDIFTLVRKPGEWKIASIAYTSIPARRE